jgi:hypothetical protein
MITARAPVEGNRKTLLMVSFGAEESTRACSSMASILLRGRGGAPAVGAGRVDHLDLNSAARRAR